MLAFWIVSNKSPCLVWLKVLSGGVHLSAKMESNMRMSGRLLISSLFQFSSVQSLSCVQLFATPGTTASQASLSITNSQSPPNPMPTESVMPSNHLILCRPLLLLPPTPPSIRVFSNESALRMRWPKYWSFSFNISPSNEYPGLIFRMDWLDLLAVQGTLKSLLQHPSSKASILQHSAFFTVQLSHPYMTAGKTIALTLPLSAPPRFSWLLCGSSILFLMKTPCCEKVRLAWPRQVASVSSYLTSPGLSCTKCHCCLCLPPASPMWWCNQNSVDTRLQELRNENALTEEENHLPK